MQPEFPNFFLLVIKNRRSRAEKVKAIGSLVDYLRFFLHNSYEQMISVYSVRVRWLLYRDIVVKLKNSKRPSCHRYKSITFSSDFISPQFVPFTFAVIWIKKKAKSNNSKIFIAGKLRNKRSNQVRRWK